MTTAAQINSTEFPRLKRLMQDPNFQATVDCLDGPDQECYPIEAGEFHVTDPSHGGKVTCHKCGDFILQKDDVSYYFFSGAEKTVVAHFHSDCYNPYEHYYALDKPID